jgi:2-oxoglutarate/2-oxoacid ferredoxin oxidoreductase subunit beta
MVGMNDFKKQDSTWCPACGNFGIWTALKKALMKLNLGPDDVCFVYGIGCHGHMVNYMKTYGFEGLHGRSLPVGAAIKMVNKNLPVVCFAGDGDCLGEGGNHFIHTIRGNHDMTLVIHDNQTYGLTTGQTSPTSLKGYKTKSTPQGVIETPFNPLAMALTAGATFVARGFSQDLAHLSDLITKAIQHKGFSVLDIYQPCVTYNKLNTYQWFKERVYKLEETGHDVTNKMEAYKKAMEEEKLPVGVFYQVQRPTYEDELPQLAGESIVSKKAQVRDITPLMKSLL